MKILVTGANGQLGRCLQKVSLKYEQIDFHFLGREHLPIDNHELARKIIIALKPDVVINAAAYTAVDRAETEYIIASNINGYAVGNLAAVCAEMKSRFIHISTDYVFDGTGNRPYLETDSTNPVNKYGETKLLGEKLAFKENPDSIIIRTSWVYSEYGHNFVKTMLRLMQEREEVKVVNDQYGSPTNAHDLADVILNIVTRNDWQGGVYHFCNEGNISWYDFAKAIQTEKHLAQCNLLPIATIDYPTLAKRPQYSCLDCTKIQSVYSIDIKPWFHSLQGLFQGL